jgi:hypothetical protein
MVNCPWCLEKKQLAAPVCPHCRRETPFQTHMDYEATATFGAAVMLTILCIPFFGWLFWEDIMAALPSFIANPWDTGKALMEPYVVWVINLFR